ncbi:MAG: gliding motility-associated ABC transporter ATP-binding subunit GldA [Cytophagales bacterium]|nr:MAG: gliding motility-associated ABC transporter ATP-binding subunit GldA [Cytophagales bacterium]
MSVKISELTKIYGNQYAVNNISFEVKKGEILGLLGPNGAGKSTTMKIATCYIPPTSGNVEISGYNVIDQAMEVKRKVGYLPEHNPLYLDMYVYEYLNFIGRVHQLKAAQLPSRIRHMIDITGLGVEQNKKIGVLSKGYRQRVGLAQALIHDPEVLILDEPTTGLDPNQILEIRSLIKNIGREKTVILSTHIMQEVKAICDKVVIINKGKIVANDHINNLSKEQENTKKLIVEFDKPIHIESIPKVNGMIKTNAISPQKIEIEHDGSLDIRAALSQQCQSNGFLIIGMTQKETSIEDLFNQLTN